MNKLRVSYIEALGVKSVTGDVFVGAVGNATVESFAWREGYACRTDRNFPDIPVLIGPTIPVLIGPNIATWKPDMEELIKMQDKYDEYINKETVKTHDDKLELSDDSPEEPSAFDKQVGGEHYKKLGMQPLELVYVNLGYEAFKGACYVKVNKYTTRKKDNEVEQLKKARHILDMWIEKAELEEGK